MILQAPFPDDVRVRNEAASLVETGHQVDLLCLAMGRQKTDEVTDGVHLLRLQAPSDTLARLNSLVYKACFIDPLWLAAIYRYVRRFQPKALHVHDLPLTRTAWLVAKRYGIPLILDMHERWPERVLSWEAKPSFLERLSTHSYSRLKALERDSLARCHTVICVSEPDVVAVRQMGGPAEKIALVPNYVDTELFRPAQSSMGGRHDAQSSRWIILYVGTVWFHRSLDIAIQAMPMVVSAIPNAHLLIGGIVKPEARRWLEDTIADTGMEQHVELPGWIDYPKVPHLISASQVLIALFKPTVPQSFSATHKLFQAMALSRPLIVSDVGDLRERVEAINCGLVVPPDDPQALAWAIIRLYRDPDLARELGQNGRRAVQEKYNWRVSAQNLITMYERLDRRERV